MSFASMTSSLPFIKAGRLRPLAVSSRERLAQLPDVPTMIEAGIPNLEVRDWQGILAARGTPKAIVDRISGDIARILKQPDTQARYAAAGMVIIASSPGEFRDALASEIKRWAKVVKDANIKPQG
jgi:tripartite-type tricarboxylate transporter receptor subunit TctC